MAIAVPSPDLIILPRKRIRGLPTRTSDLPFRIPRSILLPFPTTRPVIACFATTSAALTTPRVTSPWQTAPSAPLATKWTSNFTSPWLQSTATKLPASRNEAALCPICVVVIRFLLRATRDSCHPRDSIQHDATCPPPVLVL